MRRGFLDVFAFDLSSAFGVVVREVCRGRGRGRRMHLRLATNLMEEEHDFWKQLDDLGYRPCVEFSKEVQVESLVVLSRRQRYLMVVVSSRLNQQHNQIVDAMAIARILEATLVICILQVNQNWGDESDIFDVEDFKETLKDELRIISLLPSTHVMKMPVEESKMPL